MENAPFNLDAAWHLCLLSFVCVCLLALLPRLLPAACCVCACGVEGMICYVYVYVYVFDRDSAICLSCVYVHAFRSFLTL
jgi:hypothetical protein